MRETHVRLICSEAVVDAGRQDDQVIFFELDANPLVAFVAHIKVAIAVADVANLLIFVQVLAKETLHLGLVGITECLGRDLDLVAVLVTTFNGQLVGICHIGDVVVEDAETLESVGADGLARVMRQTLVAL